MGGIRDRLGAKRKELEDSIARQKEVEMEEEEEEEERITHGK